MARYLVTMDLPTEATPDGVLPSLEGMLCTVRETILPTLEALSALKERGVVLDGGYPSGKRSIMLIVEADSEERALEMLEGVPGWEAGTMEASQFHTLEELSDRRSLRAG
jgi:hypothetical protein